MATAAGKSTTTVRRTAIDRSAILSYFEPRAGRSQAFNGVAATAC